MDGYDKEYCWIHPHPDYEWFPDETKNQFIVEDDQGETFTIDEKSARMVHGESLRGIEDLINLGDFNEGALLHNIRERYMRDKIYTSIGSAILVAMNPYKQLPIYDLEQRNMYTGKSIKEFEKAPPHLFKMAENSYQSMLTEGKNQSMIITGESGAGKTESTKYILKYLANIQKHGDSNDNIEQRILYTNPVLEAFGNAKTVRNNNSSRFGKFIQIYFDSQDHIHSAQITNYLLEKSRIVMQSSEERAYHIFYFLVNSADEEVREKYLLNNVDEFPYINFNYSDSDEFEDSDIKDYKEMIECMDGLSFTEAEKDGIFRLVSAVAQLANVEIIEGDMEGHSLISTEDESSQNVAKLLGIEHKKLVEICCSKFIIDPRSKQKILQPLMVETAEYNRETLAKFLYSRMFDWIVDRVNVAIRKKFQGGKKKYPSIGLLDIFGFEIFEFNSFEQLCINYTNEKLQQHFNQHMFKQEKQEYRMEGIDVKNVVFVDNKDNIQLIESKSGIFGLLDDQCMFKSGSDKKFLSTLKSANGKHPSFRSGARTKHDIFGIAHFAGEVIYNIQNFVEKNKNSANKDLNIILSASKNDLISGIFSGDAFFKEKSKKRPIKKKKGNRQKSVSAQFKAQLEELMEILNESTSLYVRCIKPNTKKANNLIESKLVAGQLRCAGMLEAIRIRKGGYPVRRKFEDFMKQYKNLFKQFRIKEKNPKSAITSFLVEFYKHCDLDAIKKEIQLGKTKVFMKEHVKVVLDDLLEKSLETFVIIIQKNARMYLQRKKYKYILKQTKFLQNFFRGYFSLKRIRKIARMKIKAARKITRQAKVYLFRKNLYENLDRLLNENRYEMEPEEGEFGSTSIPVDIERFMKNKQDLNSKLDNIANGSMIENNGIEIGLDDQDNLKFNSFDEEREERFRELEGENERLSNLVSDYERRISEMINDQSENERLLNLVSDREHRISELINIQSDNQKKLDEYDYLKERVKKLSGKLREKEATLRINKIELSSFISQNKKQKQEIQTLEAKLQGGLALDDQIFEKVNKVNNAVREKDREILRMRNENKKLRKMYGDLKASVRNVSHVSENTSKDELIKTLMNQVSDLKGKADLRESQVFLNENGELQRASISRQKEEERQLLLRKNDLCKQLVNDLTTLLKFKNFEVKFIQKNSERDPEYETYEQKDQHEMLMEKYQGLKQQEVHVLLRLKRNNMRLDELTKNDEVFEESEEYEEESEDEKNQMEYEREKENTNPINMQGNKEDQQEYQQEYSDQYSDQNSYQSEEEEAPDYWKWNKNKPNNN